MHTIAKPFYYSTLPNLPHPPERFVEAISLDPNDFPTTSPFHEVRVRFCRRQGKQFLASPSVRAELPADLQSEFEQWIRDNIISEFVHAGVNYRHFNADTGGIHTDTSRQFSLTYNIDNGGPNAGITWWREKNKPLLRESGVQILDFDLVDPVMDFRGYEQGWFFHDARILHSTEGIERPRVQFQVSLNLDQVPPHWFD